MAAIEFPDIRPTSRSFSPGETPKEIFRAQNGAVTAVQFGAHRTDSSLTLTFENISDKQAREIFENYDSMSVDGDGNWDYVKFVGGSESSVGAMAGIGDTQLRRTIAESAGERKYRYTSPPQITSVFPGRSSVVVELTGYLDGV